MKNSISSFRPAIGFQVWPWFAAITAGAFLVSTAFAQSDRPSVSATIVSAPVTPLKVKVSPEALSAPPVLPTRREVPEGEPLPALPPPARTPILDPVLQGLQADKFPDALSAPFVNVAGMTSGFQPPDTTGDAGPKHYIQMVNSTQFRIFNKQGGPLGPAQTFGNLWPVGDISRRNDGDPIVVYDHLADRWLLSQFRNGGAAPNGAGDGTNSLCIAISQTSDPTAGTWFLYRFDTGPFPDYPKYGVWPDAYYVTTYEGGNLGAIVLDRANMVAGNAATFMKTTITSLGTAGVRDTRLLPADLDGPPPVPGTPGYFVRTVDNAQDPAAPANDRVEVYEGRVNWLTPSFSLVLVNTLTPAPFNTMLCSRNGLGFRDCIPQPNTTSTIDALSNRSMMQLKYRNFGSYAALVFCQTIDVSGSINALLGFTPTDEVAGIRWYELDKPGANWIIGQQGTFAPQPAGATNEGQLLHRWMGSAAINGRGDIAIGYSIVNSDSNNAVFPGIRYAGRSLLDAPGLLPQGEGTILNGANFINVNPTNRWGDYSQMSVDPVDDCTFWFTTHDANGATRIASFSVGSACDRPVITIPGDVFFTDTCVGETNFATLYVCNTGTANLEVGPITSTNAQFAVITPSSGYPVVISPDFCFPFRVRFTPTSAAAQQTTFIITSNDPSSPTNRVKGFGTGVGPRVAAFIANSGSFGDVCLGTFRDLNLTINNSGGCTLFVTNITSTSSNEFLVPLVMNYPLVIHPGDSVAVPIRFQPSGAFGSRMSVISIHSTDPLSPKMVSVSGNVPSGDVRITGSTDFGELCAGSINEKTISICNVGLCNLTVSNVFFVAPCPDFVLVNNPFPSVVSHDFCVDVVIRFTPTSCGTKSCTLRIVTDDPDMPVINLTVTASSPCASIDVPPDLAFEPEVVQTVGSCNSQLPFPISNTGLCPLFITAITLGGVNAGDYALSGLPSFPIILEAGHIVGEGDLRVVFAPTAVDRDRLATITVTYVVDPVAGTTANITRNLCGEGVRTGARVLVTHGGIPVAKVERIHLQRINANRNRPRLDTQDNANDLPLVTVIPAAPCEPFQYHREYGTVSNPIQLLPGSYQVTASAIINGKRRTLVVGFDVQTCDFNPTLVVDF